MNQTAPRERLLIRYRAKLRAVLRRQDLDDSEKIREIIDIEDSYRHQVGEP